MREEGWVVRKKSGGRGKCEGGVGGGEGGVGVE